ncbi:hypothetical protein C8Q77DRAFT_1076980 [Trametes polyzona]|nr:hypothetical protein C8Q77DRAFT_1076980 [Trametes polyzona]
MAHGLLRNDSIPLLACATAIHNLALDARKTHKTFDEIQRHMLRNPGQLIRSGLSSDWRTLTDDYGKLLHASDLSAIDIAATIDTYLSLQEDTKDEDEDDMITELSQIRKNISTASLGLSHSCGDLKQRVEALASHITCLSSAVDAHTAMSPSAVSGSSVSSPLRPLSSNSTSMPRMSLPVSTSSTLSPITIDTTTRSPWARLSGALAVLQQVSASPTRAQPQDPVRSPTDVRADASVSTRHTAQHTAQNPLENASSGLRASIAHQADNPQHSASDALVRLVKELVTALGDQTEKFKAFSEAAKHLDNEMNAYLSAFEAHKAFPTPEKHNALKNMHARVAASSKQWRQLHTVLMDGYARLRK